jgi:hypothetical protein
MWLERFVIIPMSLTRDFLPSSWGYYEPTFWDWSLFLGTMGLFTFLLFLFIKFLPFINIFEMRDLLHRIHEYQHKSNGAGHPDEGLVHPVTSEATPSVDGGNNTGPNAGPTVGPAAGA